MKKKEKWETAPHICVRKFGWSWRPRVYIHYYDTSFHEWRYVGIFRNKGNNYLGINGCKRK